ncbi:hypothetical protein AB3S75_033615 [Citrus x aurantiifolia]
MILAPPCNGWKHTSPTIVGKCIDAGDLWHLAKSAVKWKHWSLTKLCFCLRNLPIIVLVFSVSAGFLNLCFLRV